MKLPLGVRMFKGKAMADTETAAVEGTTNPQLPRVIWYKDSGLRKLYALTTIIIISSATNGYDG